MKYRPEIDGLRCIAVVAVVFFHMDIGMPGGFVGVDVFFVISGFLITRIILRGLDKDTFSLAEFWERRMKRIFPALFVVLVATFVVGCWLLSPNELVELGKSSLAQALLLANVYFWGDTGYFAAPAELKPLLHTWSLAVEEQFYLFFPLVLWFFRRKSRKALFVLLGVVALSSFIGSVYGTKFHPKTAFFLLPARTWELLIGCMLAVCPRQCNSSTLRDTVLATIGLAAVILPMFLYDSMTPFPGIAAAPPVLGTAAIMFAAESSPHFWLVRVLSFRPVVFVGLISYSLYLWHWPVIVYTRMYFGHFDWKQAVFAIGVTFVLAVLSWRFVETPFRRTSVLRSRRAIFATVLTLNVATIFVSVFFISQNGLPRRFPGYSPETESDVTWIGEAIHVGRDREDLDVLVFGDSHGMALSQSINSLAMQYGVSAEGVMKSGQIPLPNVTRTDNADGGFENLIYEIKRRRPRHVLLIARWSFYVHGSSELDESNKVVQLVDPASATSPSSNTEIIERNLEWLGEICKKEGATLWVLKEVPETGETWPASQFLRYCLGRIRRPSDSTRTVEEHEQRTAQIDSVFRSMPEGVVRFVDPAPLLFDENQRTINYLDGRSLYRDNDHLTRWGAEKIRPVLEMMVHQMQNKEGVSQPSGIREQAGELPEDVEQMPVVLPVTSGTPSNQWYSQ